jgi:predicted DNA-binding ribbon-helix-helix protein
MPTSPRKPAAARKTVAIERVQTGVRLEKRLLKVLKGLAEYLDLSLGDLMEGVLLHAVENKAPFSAATLKRIEDLKRIYGLDLGAEDSHRLREH